MTVGEYVSGLDSHKLVHSGNVTDCQDDQRAASSAAERGKKKEAAVVSSTLAQTERLISH